MKTVSAWSYTLSMKEKEVSNSDILNDITPQNQIQIWQFLKLCLLLSLAKQGYSQSCNSAVFFSQRRKQEQLLCFCSSLLRTKANRKVPLKERTSKLRAGIKASADSVYPNPCLLDSLKNLPTRTVWETSQSVTYQSCSPEILAKALTEEQRLKP